MPGQYPYGPPKHKVTLLGASGGIGQPLALLLKLNPMIGELALYDIEKAMVPCKGVAIDVAHVNTPAKVTGYAGDAEMPAALTGASVVVVTAGVPRKPGMTRDDLFKINAKIAQGLAQAIGTHAPKAMILLVTNPVNSIVPVVCETLKQMGVFNWRQVCGITTLDTLRACTFVAEITGSDPRFAEVPVVGGHAGATILPLLSKCKPALPAKFSADDVAGLDKKIQEAGTAVVDAKGGAGSATLSMAQAAAKFTDSVLMGISGVQQAEYSYVNVSSPEAGPVGAATGLEYYSSLVDIGPMGIMGARALPSGLSAYEVKRLEEVKTKLAEDIKTGIDFVKANPVTPAK